MQTPSIAQTFTIPQQYTTGLWVTSVNLYFSAKKTLETEAVQVDIINTVNGYPDSTTHALTSAIVPASAITASATSLIATKVTFQKLIQLAPNVEYAIRITTNSSGYKLWTSFMGEAQVGQPGLLITKQPSLGSFFKSQNSSTWTPEQLQDLTFTLNRAKFDTSKIGNLQLVDSQSTTKHVLPQNPFKLTSGSAIVVVHYPSHGLETGMKVGFGGCADTQFNTTFLVTTVPNNDYIHITTTAAQTTTNNVGGSNTVSEKQIKFDTYTVSGIYETQNGKTKTTIKTSSATANDSTSSDISIGSYTDLTVSKYIHTSVNKNFLLAGNNSLYLNVQLYSLSDTDTPVVDLDGVKLTLVGNKINSPSPTAVNYTVDGVDIVIGSSNVSFTAPDTITLPATTDYTVFKVGSQIKIVDAGGLNDGLTGILSYLDTSTNTIKLTGSTLVTQASRSATINQYDTYVSEIAPTGSSSDAKYVTKITTINQLATSFRVMFHANIHTDAEIELWYRTTSGSSLEKQIYTQFPISYTKSVVENDFIEYAYDITGLAKFNKFQFKFVLKSTNSAVTPKIKMLRIIATS